MIILSCATEPEKEMTHLDFNITEISTNLHTETDILYDRASVYNSTGSNSPTSCGTASLCNNMNAGLRAC